MVANVTFFTGEIRLTISRTGIGLLQYRLLASGPHDCLASHVIPFSSQSTDCGGTLPASITVSPA